MAKLRSEVELDEETEKMIKQEEEAKRLIEENAQKNKK